MPAGIHREWAVPVGLTVFNLFSKARLRLGPCHLAQRDKHVSEDCRSLAACVSVSFVIGTHPFSFFLGSHCPQIPKALAELFFELMCQMYLDLRWVSYLATNTFFINHQLWFPFKLQRGYPFPVKLQNDFPLESKALIPEPVNQFKCTYY